MQQISASSFFPKICSGKSGKTGECTAFARLAAFPTAKESVSHSRVVPCLYAGYELQDNDGGEHDGGQYGNKHQVSPHVGIMFRRD